MTTFSMRDADNIARQLIRELIEQTTGVKTEPELEKLYNPQVEEIAKQVYKMQGRGQETEFKASQISNIAHAAKTGKLHKWPGFLILADLLNNYCQTHKLKK